MKKIYFRFRVLLMTFALGLASVIIFNGSLQIADEAPVNFLQTKTESSVIIIPQKTEVANFAAVDCRRKAMPVKNQTKSRGKNKKLNHK